MQVSMVFILTLSTLLNTLRIRDRKTRSNRIVEQGTVFVKFGGDGRTSHWGSADGGLVVHLSSPMFGFR